MPVTVSHSAAATDTDPHRDANPSGPQAVPLSDPAVQAAIAARVQGALHRRRAWHPGEYVFWAFAFASIFLFPNRAMILSEIAILGLFALSLDLVLGFAGIVSLGHAAFLGVGAYTAGILAKHGFTDPILGLMAAAGLTAVLGFVTSFLVLRGTDLTRLMVTMGVALILGEIANQQAWLTGGADGLQGIVMGPVLGIFEFDLWGHTAYCYSLAVLFLVFIVVRRVTNSPFGLSLLSVRDNPLRAAAIGVPVNQRLVAIYTLAAAIAGIAGGLLAQTTQFVSTDVLDFARSADVLLILIIGGTGYLYGGLVGAVIFKMLQDTLSSMTPQYWHFWIGVLLVALVLAGRERVIGAVGNNIRALADRLPGASRHK